MSTVGNEDSILAVETFLFEILQFLEEGGDIDNDTGTDEIEAFGVNQSYSQLVKVTVIETRFL